ncbi:MAG: hypothetical protein WBW16_00210 [Bacteroidota bacterium]
MILFVAALMDPPERFAQQAWDCQATVREAKAKYGKRFSQSRRTACGQDRSLKT